MSIASLAGMFCLGFLVGLLFFRALWWATRALVGGGGFLLLFACHLGRFALLGASLVWAVGLGAWPLLAMTVGIILARLVTLRQFRSAKA